MAVLVRLHSRSVTLIVIVVYVCMCCQLLTDECYHKTGLHVCGREGGYMIYGAVVQARSGDVKIPQLTTGPIVIS